ncbi:MAG: hypothetical protein BWY28_02617 [bacterium ADurb.Bin236]|nr:MAG: hypothetical protein BWY28_02617 [bacterium ADurb.Bin236]HOY64376.1 hypothetical protein [bacterium]HPN94611.1 hypothetical protein [bacterium]
MISNTGKIIMAILVLGIGFAALTAPKKPSSPLKNVPTMMEIQNASKPRIAGGEVEPEVIEAMQEDGAAPVAGKMRQPAPVKPPAAKPAPQAAAMIPEDIDLLQERYGRPDPFAPLFDLPVEPEITDFDLPDLFPLPAPMPRSVPNFKLSAVALGGGAPMAVINGQILGVGDGIEDFAISSIQMDGVKLVGADGYEIVLKIKQDMKGLFDVAPGSISNVEN